MTDKATGKAAGGHARKDVLTAKRRKEIAVKAAEKRWNEPTLKATHGSLDHPLRIGDIEIPCYVLEDGTRVLSQRGLMGGVGVTLGSGSGGDDRLTSLLTSKGISSFVSNDLLAMIKSPIKFVPPHGGRSAYGYPATILADICDVILAARKADAESLTATQANIAARCEILVRGFARVGIIALIDEVTGYQKDRAAGALARILEAFIAKELQPYIPTFPTAFYQEMFRLRGLPFPNETVKRPQYFGCLTNNIIYDRLAPGVREELQKGVPRNEAGRPVAKYFQKLTQNTGYPKLRELLGSVVTLMKLSKDWPDFMGKMNMLHPKQPKVGETYELGLQYKPEEDTGEGL